MKNQQASKSLGGKTSKHTTKPAPSKALKEAAKIIGKLGGRPRKDPQTWTAY